MKYNKNKEYYKNRGYSGYTRQFTPCQVNENIAHIPNNILYKAAKLVIDFASQFRWFTNKFYKVLNSA